MKRNQGLSLIVLVITIIVIIILAGAVIINLAKNNSIDEANEAVFKSNVSIYNSELSLALANKYLENYSFNPNTFDIGIWNGSEVEGTIKQYIPSITIEDGLKFEIKSGKLVYVGDNYIEQDWCINMGMEYAIVKENTTINGSPASYNNPIIPKGFRAVNDGAIWPTDWDKGLVIEDEVGNQFVWVPIDGIDLVYEKWCTTAMAHSLTTDDTLPAGVTNEQYQITTYGGFYIGRYTAGVKNNDVLVSKKEETVWNWINYTDAKTKSELMYNTDEIRSGLVTGTQWDTVLAWIESTGKSATDSRNWGNYSNSTNPANVTGYGTAQVTGYSEYWKANNLYDIAGNTWEWTSEIYSSSRVFRGGEARETGNGCPAASRFANVTGFDHRRLGFRVVLYIL